MEGLRLSAGYCQIFKPNGRLLGSFVYLVLCGDNDKIYVKVGRSNNPFQRLGDLRVGCPMIPEILAVAEVANLNKAKRLESHLHDALKAWRTHGEWFAFTRADKVDFNNILNWVLQNHSCPSYRVKLKKYSVPKLIKAGERRRRFMQIRFARMGKAYKDFKNATQ